ncbi:MAG: hypothetical protein E7423_01980 [Ruminococcaceae bacterium]|nr:hypothetical protein [Oscillospiraceae bacterium]
MAYAITASKWLGDKKYIEAVLDSASDLAALGDGYAPDSRAIVAEGGAAYMTDASGHWQELGSPGGGGVTPADNGKVVVNGQLTEQTARTVTSNDTYDTTANNSVTVAVPIQQSKSVTIDEAGTVTITPDSGYEAMGEVVVTAEVPSVSTMTLFAHVENGQTTPHFATVGVTCGAALLGKTAAIAVADGDTTSGTYVVFSISTGAATVVFWRGTDETKITAARSSSGWTITGATSLDMYRASIVLPDSE